MTTVNVTALDTGGAPIPDLEAVASAIPTPLHLATGEVVASATVTTDDTGLASFDLAPSPEGASVWITAGAGHWQISVPDSGDYSVGDPTIAHNGRGSSSPPSVGGSYDDNEVPI